MYNVLRIQRNATQKNFVRLIFTFLSKFFAYYFQSVNFWLVNYIRIGQFLLFCFYTPILLLLLFFCFASDQSMMFLFSALMISRDIKFFKKI